MIDQITPEEMAKFRRDVETHGCFITKTSEGTRLLDTVDALRAEVQRLAELRDALVESVGTEGGIPMTDRLADALESCGVDAVREVEAVVKESSTTARRPDAGRVEVPEEISEALDLVGAIFYDFCDGDGDGVGRWRCPVCERFTRMDYTQPRPKIQDLEHEPTCLVALASRLSPLSPLPSPQPATGASEEWAPVLQEAFADNGEHSHWNLFDPKTGELLWTEAPEEEWHKHHRRPPPQPSADVAVVPRDLFKELRDNCEATLAESGISAFRKEYRAGLLQRADDALLHQPRQQGDAMSNPKIVQIALPCPFCGAPPEIEPWHGGAKSKRMISCSNENCPVLPGVTGETPREAWKKWNTRRVPATNHDAQDAG